MNIVLIFADQMHKYALGRLRDYVFTPNLDRLSEKGVLFTDAYSNNPICGPFRGGCKNIFSNALVSGIDLFPTFLEYARLPVEPHLQGNSIAPYTMGREQSFSSPVFAEYLIGSGGQWKMVRDVRYKLTVDWQTKDAKLLFDMEKDPFEMENLVCREEYSEVVQRLKEMIMNL